MQHKRSASTPILVLLVAVTAGLLLCGTNGCSGSGGTTMTRSWDGPINGKAVFRHVEKLVGFGPRPSGSKALEHTVQYIQSEIEKLGLRLERQEFSIEEAPGITFRNLYCVIPGTDEQKRTLVVSAHYDTKKTEGHPKPEQNFRFVGAMDGATGPALLIELAKALKDRKNVPTIYLVWFDGEESIPYDWPEDGIGSPLALIGSRKFAQWMMAEKIFPKVMVLYDLVGSKDFKLDRDTFSNKSLQDMFAETAAEMGQGERMYEYAQSHLIDDHRMFLEHGDGAVRVIDLIDFRYRTDAKYDRMQHGDKSGIPPEGTYVRWWHTPEDDLHNVDPVALDFCGNLLLKTLPKIEAKYYR
ncbi:MAG: M28 family peptidase [Planctomycetes bacterium]|nr:M28 family peptidase [Planctomycetota bacterium]